MAGDGHIGAGNHDELGQGEEVGERRKEGRKKRRKETGRSYSCTFAQI